VGLLLAVRGGGYEPQKFKSITGELRRYELDREAFNRCLSDLADPVGRHPSPTVLTLEQNNSALAAAARLDRPFRLVCRFFYEFPWFGDLLEELVQCVMTTPPDVVLLRDFVIAVPQLARLEAFLSENYTRAGSCDNMEVLIRETK